MAQIKTIQFNDFSEFQYSDLENKDSFLKNIQEFVEEGGNLNLPVKRSGDTLEKAITFFMSVLSEDNISDNGVKGKDYSKVQYLFEHDLLKSPGDFEIKNDTLYMSSLYDSYWYRDYSDFFENHLVEKFTNFLEVYKKIENKPSKFVSYDGTNRQERGYRDALFFLVDTIQLPKVYDVLFTNMPEAKKIWNVKDTQFSREVNIFEQAIQRIGRDKQNELTLVFYKHGIGKKELFNDNNRRGLRQIVEHCIRNNDIATLEKIYGDCDLKALEREESAYSAFLTYAKTPEMAKFLLSKGAMVFEETDKGIQSSIFSNGRIKNIKVLETILDSDPKYSELISKYHLHFFSEYFDRSFSSDIIKLLITKYDFPVLEYDLIKIGNHMNPIEGKGIIDMLSMGADPRKCSKFISEMVAKREEGLSTLKYLKKEKIFDAFYPDPLFNLLFSSTTKSNFKWIEKTTTQELERKTKNGFPAWWGISNVYGKDAILSRLSDLNQKSDNGMTILYFIAKKLNDRKYESYDNNSLNLYDFISDITKKQHKLHGNQIDISYINEEGNNIFHQLANADLKSKDSRSNNFVRALTEQNYPNIGHLLSSPNKEGITPLELYVSNESNLANVSQTIRNLIEAGGSDIDYYQTNSQGIPLFEVIKEWADRHHMTEKVNEYKSIRMANHLEGKLSNTEDKVVVKRNKI